MKDIREFDSFPPTVQKCGPVIPYGVKKLLCTGCRWMIPWEINPRDSHNWYGVLELEAYHIRNESRRQKNIK